VARSDRLATILHIEDDPNSLLLVRRLLHAAGNKVIETSSGLEGARLAGEHRPDLVLLDINIPDLDGYEVALLLRGRIPNTPIVAVTAEGDRAHSLAIGCHGFLAKPIDVRQFPRQISMYLAGHREQRDPDVSGTGVLRIQGEKIVRKLEDRVHQLNEAKERLVEADRLRREFYRNVSHELATPLTPIVGYMNLLTREELGPLNPAQRKAMGAIDEALGRLRATIDNLLDVTQLETGRMRFAFARYDLCDVVRRVIDARQSQFLQRGIRLHASVPVTPGVANGDAERIARAVMHLLDNAAKFNAPGSAAAIELRLTPSTGEILVCDSGSGVRHELLERIFEPFVQGDGSPTRQHGGAGVGLAIVKRVAEAHGGSATAEIGGREVVAGQHLHGLMVRVQIARAARPPTNASA
jgi:signal transduction histidine kinase